mmetsp:Transcript_16303/g.28518  ORF Transcript_16303/g.28518 Transcript_16303/m.28518 type:complete len:231 (-) Transcript_16303:741-1433(-)
MLTRSIMRVQPKDCTHDTTDSIMMRSSLNTLKTRTIRMTRASFSTRMIRRISRFPKDPLIARISRISSATPKMTTTTSKRFQAQFKPMKNLILNARMRRISSTKKLHAKKLATAVYSVSSTRDGFRAKASVCRPMKKALRMIRIPALSSAALLRMHFSIQFNRCIDLVPRLLSLSPSSESSSVSKSGLSRMTLMDGLTIEALFETVLSLPLKCALGLICAVVAEPDISSS